MQRPDGVADIDSITQRERERAALGDGGRDGWFEEIHVRVLFGGWAPGSGLANGPTGDLRGGIELSLGGEAYQRVGQYMRTGGYWVLDLESGISIVGHLALMRPAGAWGSSAFISELKLPPTTSLLLQLNNHAMPTPIHRPASNRWATALSYPSSPRQRLCRLQRCEPGKRSDRAKPHQRNPISITPKVLIPMDTHPPFQHHLQHTAPPTLPPIPDSASGSPGNASSTLSGSTIPTRFHILSLRRHMARQKGPSLRSMAFLRDKWTLGGSMCTLRHVCTSVEACPAVFWSSWVRFSSMRTNKN